MLISIIVPVFNEAENLNELYSIVMGLGLKECELIFIDDGSKDKSYNILKELHKKDGRVKIIKFRKNFGQTAAFDAGFRHASGEIIITMDADLQNDPNDIPKLINKLNEGYDVVNGWRLQRKDTFGKKLASKFRSWLAMNLLNTNLHDLGCSLRAYKRDAIKDLRLFGDMHRYIPTIIALRGFKICEIEVAHHPRAHGQTKYNYKRLFNGFMDMLYIKFWMNYSTRPLHFFGFLGVAQYAVSFVLFAEQLIKDILIRSFYVGPILMLAILLVVTGTLFMVCGLLGEIQIRTYYEGTNKNAYSIENILDKNVKRNS